MDEDILFSPEVVVHTVTITVQQKDKKFTFEEFVSFLDIFTCIFMFLTITGFNSIFRVQNKQLLICASQ